MSLNDEYNNAISELKNLLSASTIISPDKLEIYFNWVVQHTKYVIAEHSPFSVTEVLVPQTISVETYNFLSNKIPDILATYYTISGTQYVKHQTGMSAVDATKLYCNMYLQPRSVVWIDFGFNVGYEFGGKHPAIILKNLNNSVFIVAPVSTNANNCQQPSNTVVTFNNRDFYNMPSLRDRFTNITRIIPVSIYRLDTTSPIGSVKKTKYQELIGKIKNYF